jgi:hypothetical protein
MMSPGMPPQLSLNRPTPFTAMPQLAQQLEQRRLQNLLHIEDLVSERLNQFSKDRIYGPRELADLREATDHRKLDQFA